MKLIKNLHLLSRYSYLFLIQTKLNDHKIEIWRLIKYYNTLHKSISFSLGHRVLGRYLPQKVLISISVWAFCKPIIYINSVSLLVCDKGFGGGVGGGEGEAGEVAGDWCQSVIGLGKGRTGHGLGTSTSGNWARARTRTRTGHEHGHDHGQD